MLHDLHAFCASVQLLTPRPRGKVAHCFHSPCLRVRQRMLETLSLTLRAGPASDSCEPDDTNICEAFETTSHVGFVMRAKKRPNADFWLSAHPWPQAASLDAAGGRPLPGAAAVAVAGLLAASWHPSRGKGHRPCGQTLGKTPPSLHKVCVNYSCFCD